MATFDKTFSEYGSIITASSKLKQVAAQDNLSRFDAIDIYSQQHLKNMRQAFEENLKDDMYRMVRAFPTFKFYFVEEDEEELLLFDDLYGYNSVQSIEIHKSKDNAADTAVVTVSNFLGNLDTNVIPPPKEKLVRTKSGSLEEIQPEIQQTRLSSGTKVQLRLGYSSKVNELELVFTGRITNIEYGDMITFHASGFGSELLYPKGWDYRETYRRGKEAVQLNVLRRMLNYPEIKNFGISALSNSPEGIQIFGENQDKTTALTPEAKKRKDITTNILAKILDEGPKEMNIYLERSNRFFNAINILKEFRVANTTPWDVFQEIARMNPGYVAAVVPYDNRATLFFGKPEQPYFWTSGSSLPHQQEAYKEWEKNKEQYSYKKLVMDRAGNIQSEEERRLNDTNVYRSKFFDLLKKNSVAAKIYINTADLGTEIFGRITSASKSRKFLQNSRPEKVIVNEKYISSWYKLSKKQPLNSDDRKNIENSLKNDVDGSNMGKNVVGLAVSLIRSEPDRFSKMFKAEKIQSPVGLLGSEYPRAFMFSFKGPGKDNVYIDKRGNIVTERAKNSNVGLSPRQRPFRNYHYKDSDHHIISNNITLNLDDFHNTVVVEYPKNIWRQARSQQDEMARVDSGFKTLCADKDIPPEFRRTIVVRENNIETSAQALNCALSHLQKETAKVYQGELIVLGDPKIKPHDIVYIYDMYTDMYGPIEVREVVHSMSEETGFITTIIPDMCVNVNSPTVIPDVLYNALIFAGLVVLGATAVATGGATLGFAAFLTKASIGFTGFHFFRSIGKDFFPLFYEYSGTKNINKKEPIKICPLVYDGKPYIAGFEGKDRKDWNIFTLDGFKKGWTETQEGALAAWIRVGRSISIMLNRNTRGE